MSQTKVDHNSSMTETSAAALEIESLKHSEKAKKKHRCCIIATVTAVLLLILLVVILILAFTVFKVKNPKIQVVSTTLEGVSPRISFPRISIELNITMNVVIRVNNPNHASFKHGEGNSVVFYRDKQVGDVLVAHGKIPARGGETIKCRLTLEADQFADVMSELIDDVMAGELAVDVKTRIPGRVNFLGIKKHAIATSTCHIIIGMPDLKVKQQVCKNKTKL